MKKVLFSVASFMFMNLIMSGNLKAEMYKQLDWQRVDVATVAFSSASMQAFVGEGLVFGWGCSSSSVFSNFQVWDSSTVIPNPSTTGEGVNFIGRRILRHSNFQNQYSTSNVASGDVWFPYPIRVRDGAAFDFSDNTANNAHLYIKKLTQ